MPTFWQLPSKGHESDGHTADFVAECRNLRVTPHVAQNLERPSGSAIDARTTQDVGYAISQRKTKRFEECFGWLKTIALLRKVRHRGGLQGGMGLHLCCSCLQRRPYTEPGDFKRRKLRSQIAVCFANLTNHSRGALKTLL